MEGTMYQSLLSIHSSKSRKLRPTLCSDRAFIIKPYEQGRRYCCMLFAPSANISGQDPEATMYRPLLPGYSLNVGEEATMYRPLLPGYGLNVGEGATVSSTRSYLPRYLTQDHLTVQRTARPTALKQESTTGIPGQGRYDPGMERRQLRLASMNKESATECRRCGKRDRDVLNQTTMIEGATYQHPRGKCDL